jgi:hypothetical protein
MPISAKSMKEVTAFDRFKGLLVGKEKTGKSRVAATGRKPILFFDYDNRSESVAGIDGVYTLSFSEPPYPNQPTAYNEGLEVIQRLEYDRRLNQIHADFRTLSDDIKIKTVVPDSIASLSRASLNYALYTTPDLRRQVVSGNQYIFVPRNYDAWNSDIQMVEQFVLRLLAIPDVDVIAILHEEMEKDETRSDEKRTYYTGKIDVYPGRHRNLIKFFNELWRITRPSSVPIAQLLPSYEFTCATNLLIDGNPGTIENPNIANLINETLAKQNQFQKYLVSGK